MPTHTAKTFLIRSLLETTLPVQSTPAVPRKHLTVPPSRMAGLVVHVVAWYAAMKGSFANAETLYDGLLHTIKGFIATLRVPARAHAPRRWPYATDPVILNCQQTLTAYQRSWQLNPADTESRNAIVTVARHLMDLRQKERMKYKVSFLDKVRRTRSFQVWHHVNSVWGKCDPDSAGRARELVLQWKPHPSLAFLWNTRRRSINKDHEGWS
ncbi:hypothetical protein E2C01_102628 [Portunus trituberculatus]|uniref:Uncharacterized protein n=1 Tax=Portunus trituberculatus TaxID=210409 RepID=A0A5B7KHS7_PORTR|nr:hypothetical protein [Portunus trituberculatus]